MSPLPALSLATKIGWRGCGGGRALGEISSKFSSYVVLFLLMSLSLLLIGWRGCRKGGQRVRSPQSFLFIVVVSSDRSSYSDDGLLYNIQLFEFSLSPLMQLMLQLSL